MAGWIVEATGTREPGMAVRIMATFPEEPTRDQQQDVRARLSGCFRVFYQEWPSTNSVRAYQNPGQS